MLDISQSLSPCPKPMPEPSQLGFGQHFTDHWFRSTYREGRGWSDSRVEPYGPLSLDPAASVFHYGQALFEGMKAFRQVDGSVKVFRPDFNFNRLREGAARLCLVPPSPEIFFEGLQRLLEVDERWVPADEGCSLYIRPTLIGTEAFLGVRPSREIVFFIMLSPVGSYYSEGFRPLRIHVEDKALRAAPGGLGATKAGANYAASLQAALRAREKGFAQVLWLDVEREGIEEVGTMNVFFVLKDEIVTPALNGSILAGGVRDSVIRVLARQGRPVTERRITIREVLDRHAKGELLEAFGTGTAAVISPIGEFSYQDRAYTLNSSEMGPVSRDLLAFFKDLQRGRGADPFGWMVPVQSLRSVPKALSQNVK